MTPQGQQLRDTVTSIEQAVLVLAAPLVQENVLMTDLLALKNAIEVFDMHLGNYQTSGSVFSSVASATPTQT